MVTRNCERQKNSFLMLPWISVNCYKFGTIGGSHGNKKLRTSKKFVFDVTVDFR
ncbi:MAG: hypothetical protein FWG65_01340 [Turicibacter sp.]|nr:hypothetical protein [Turicibacter sp.]